MSEPRLRSLLRQARKIADAGKRTAAAQVYRQIVEEAPDSEEGWLGLASVLNDPDEQRQAYEQVLVLSPDNEAALRGLDRLAPRQTGDAAPQLLPADDPFEQTRGWLDDATTGMSLAKLSTDNQSPARTASAPISSPESQASAPVEPERTSEEFHDLACYRHPNRETSLRCYSCNRPICSECAVKTPVGYRCPTCIREAEDAFFNARPLDYLIAPLISLPLSLLAGYLVLRFGRGDFFFIFLMLFLGGAIGGLIGRVSKRMIDRRRGRYLPHVVAFTVVLGVILPLLFFLMLGARISLGSLLVPGIYLFVATSAAFYQMK